MDEYTRLKFWGMVFALFAIVAALVKVLMLLGILR
jgi:hypothetical protein